MQDLSTNATVTAITAQVLSEEKSPDQVLGRILRDYIFIDTVRLPTGTKTKKSSSSQRMRNAINMFKKNPIKLSAVLGTGIFYLGLALGYQLIATFTNRILGHNVGRSSNPHTGAWYPDILDPVHMVDTSIFPAVNEFQTDLIFKAIAYADNCYRKASTERECSLFYTPKIEYQERHNAGCPFAKQLCLGGLNGAYELDTGWNDARVLGINEKHTCQFRSRRICSPLAIDGYTRTQEVQDSGTKYVEYMLGDGWGIVQEGNKTFGELVRDPLRTLNEPANYLIR
ncbi:hypothetical protein GQ44DRAFT_200113 [Phaeosphaeriaceae sp. PMI808]|nr:hypothetical protein GQ44DRAFT_200113 [Phaeosphaeriaceae sp. PMI808]